MPVDFDKECFFIAPIGEEGSEVRKRSDGVLDWVVRPAAKAAAGLVTVRADDVGEPGQITAQAIQHCLKARAAVADLTGGNPNVFYELSVRHGALLPVALIAEEGTKLPFDVSQSRVIFFDPTDLASAGRARESLQVQIEASLSGPPDNPISDGMRLAQLQAGNAEEQTLAVVVERLQRLSHTTDQIDERLRRAERRDMIKTNIRPAGVRAGKLGTVLSQAEVDEILSEQRALSPQEELELRTEAEADQALFDPRSDPDGD
jgi:hypothetical protein